ncbi:MAG: hypothetical protein LBC59_05010 [Chitinispirillales bacterium]|jgi:TolB-like protein|nr:hypothetical protein [Chitinispirillales bacterium]
MKVTTVIKAMALVALLAGMSAAGVKYVAVVETDVDAASGASAELNPAEVRLITAELRRQATENMPRDKYNVMTSETVQSMGGAVLEECADENCVITLGSKIGADYIVRGTVSKFGTKLTLSVELYETENGTLVVTSETVRSGNIEELLEKATVACGEMYRKFIGGQGQTAVVATKSTENYTADVRDNSSSSDNQYVDFTTGQRWGTWALNVPGGFGSFLIMKDYVGGGIMLGANIAYVLLMNNMENIHRQNDFQDNIAADISEYTGLAIFIGGQIFNIVRSVTYHKPKPKSSVAANWSSPKKVDTPR